MTHPDEGDAVRKIMGYLKETEEGEGRFITKRDLEHHLEAALFHIREKEDAHITKQDLEESQARLLQRLGIGLSDEAVDKFRNNQAFINQRRELAEHIKKNGYMAALGLILTGLSATVVYYLKTGGK